MNKVQSMAAMTAGLTLTMALLGCDEHRRLGEVEAAQLNDPAQMHRIGYRDETDTLTVELPPHGDGLSRNQIADIYRFGLRYRTESNCQLRVTVPASGDRSNSDLRQALRDAGLTSKQVHVTRGAHRRHAGSIHLAFDRPVAVGPECGRWPTDLGRDRERLHYDQFGCANQRNIAGMVANGRDLMDPQAETPASGERRGRVWSKYVGMDANAAPVADAPDKGKASAAKK